MAAVSVKRSIGNKNKVNETAITQALNKGLFTWRCGTPDRWGNPLRWRKKITLLYMESYNPAIPGCTFSRLLNGRQARKQEMCWQTTFFRGWCFFTLACCSCCKLQCCGFLLLPLIMMQSYRQSEFCGNSVSRIRPRLGGLPHLETFTWQNLTPAARVTRSGRPGYPPWRVTPPVM